MTDLTVLILVPNARDRIEQMETDLYRRVCRQVAADSEPVLALGKNAIDMVYPCSLGAGVSSGCVCAASYAACSSGVNGTSVTSPVWQFTTILCMITPKEY